MLRIASRMTSQALTEELFKTAARGRSSCYHACHIGTPIVKAKKEIKKIKFLKNLTCVSYNLSSLCLHRQEAWGIHKVYFVEVATSL